MDAPCAAIPPSRLIQFSTFPIHSLARPLAPSSSESLSVYLASRSLITSSRLLFVEARRFLFVIFRNLASACAHMSSKDKSTSILKDIRLGSFRAAVFDMSLSWSGVYSKMFEERDVLTSSSWCLSSRLHSAAAEAECDGITHQHRQMVWHVMELARAGNTFIV